uniref:Uncharacterized protein n=1 Tax=Panagrolaimus sp. ES5 TaxID=591445 RepID=A0AC34G569_9BILA
MSNNKKSTSKPRQRSKSQTKTNYSHPQHQLQQQPGWNNSTEIVVVEDDGSNKLFAKPANSKTQRRKSSISSSSELSSSTLSHRPPFNLDTRIDGYDDVDENGKYRKKLSESAVKAERKKSQLHQNELNEQWAESLRDNFYH